MAFADATRLKHVPTDVLTKPSGGGVSSIMLPKTGILSYILLPITATVSGTLSNPNALGLASIVRRVSLTVNGGQKLFDFSGAGYHYLIREFLSEQGAHLSWTNARSAVTATTATLDMIIPVAMNPRDETGLFMLQNEYTLATLSIDWEIDSNVATGATVTGSASPVLGVFEVPTEPNNWPAMNTIHQLVEEQSAIAASGAYRYDIPRGGTLLGVYHLLPNTTYTLAELVVQQSNIIEALTPAQMALRFDLNNQGRDATLSGALTGNNRRVFWDFAGSDGLGQFGTFRDAVDTQALTSIFSRLTVAGAGTLYSVRRQILPLAA